MDIQEAATVPLIRTWEWRAAVGPGLGAAHNGEDVQGQRDPQRETAAGTKKKVMASTR
jgi:hypothetical protein